MIRILDGSCKGGNGEVLSCEWSLCTCSRCPLTEHYKLSIESETFTSCCVATHPGGYAVRSPTRLLHSLHIPTAALSHGHELAMRIGEIGFLDVLSRILP